MEIDKRTEEFRRKTLDILYRYIPLGVSIPAIKSAADEITLLHMEQQESEVL